MEGNMKYLLAVLSCIFPVAVYADLPELTSEEIIQQLNHPKPKLRGIKTRSLVAAPKIETRGLSRIRYTKDNQEIKEFVYLPVKQVAAHVNLNIEFDSNSYRIREGSYQALNALGEALNNNKLVDKNFYINGHTDADGSEQNNLQLSLKRALAVRYFLIVNHRIAENRLRLSGYGEGKPLVANTTPRNKQLNRRVEIVLR